MACPLSAHSPQPRRLVRVPIPGQLLAHALGLLVHEPEVQFEVDLPEGAKFVRWFADPVSDAIMMVFEHESFPEVEPGSEVPLAAPLMMTIRERKE